MLPNDPIRRSPEQPLAFVPVFLLSLLAPSAAVADSAADCHIGAYRLGDGSLIDLGATEGGIELRYRQFDGVTGVLHPAKTGTWTSTLGWTDRPDGKHFVLGACDTSELRVDDLTAIARSWTC